MLKGFDTSAYPGDITMKALKANFDFVAFYLGPAPSHQDSGWMVRLSTLRNLKYKFLPIFVGQQIIGPGAKNPSASQGVVDAKAAARLMGNAGFNHGSPVYIDLENGPPYTAPEKAYVEAWVEEIKALGFTPGIYCSHLLTPAVANLGALIWDFQIPTTQRTYDTPAAALPSSVPTGRAARQYRQNVVLRGPGILVDLDAANDASGLAS